MDTRLTRPRTSLLLSLAALMALAATASGVILRRSAPEPSWLDGVRIVGHKAALVAPAAPTEAAEDAELEAGGGL